MNLFTNPGALLPEQQRFQPFADSRDRQAGGWRGTAKVRSARKAGCMRAS
ncbi:hypothetical protein MUG10_02990 [Xanthomonas prunicola]|uniref:Uncharacterized protein n=1 Tax=Xanthomonas prunicola TaxID=2053930 RepID=A0A9Q9J552_9XANT|nr:hypothetical protein [Xanthomonas prunicola]USJ01217.1 hypothetical protein MUG10_02990 [Xanthomonas prunicola]UXA49747.1 hypothetical protein M0D44_04070 [Xanthomonas prunicola]UXA58044.1 hypothetical protein M0D47_04055 [Xanthomonas prunicola]UXA60193.1 hypothetical protein M0D48_14350 [Xanthomonas prunicola]UXA66256.1 hypothetical protein M0D43_04280 [Xanthomonas prunicola]